MADINFGLNILPKTNSAYNLGSNDYKWNLYVNQINGDSIDNIGNGAPIIINQKTDNPIVINDGISGQKLDDIKVSFFPKQEGTEDPSPSNVRPISGYSDLTVYRTGKNLFNKDGNGIIDGYFGSKIVTSDSSFKTIFVQCVGGKTYTVSKTAGQRFLVGYTTETPAANVPVYGIITDQTATSITITTGDDARYIVAFIYNGAYDTITAAEMLASIQVEANSYATTYESFVSLDSFPVVFPALGKNLWNFYTNGYYANDGSFQSGGASACSYKIPVVSDQKYTFGAVNNGSVAVTLRGYCFDADEHVVGDLIYGANPLTITIPEGAETAAFWISATGYEQMTKSEAESLGIQVVKGETLGTYEPYTNMAYGGSLNLVSGVLTIKYGMYVFDGDDEFIYIDDVAASGKTWHRFKTNVLDYIIEKNTSISTYCNMGVRSGATAKPDFRFYIGSPYYAVIFYLEESLCTTDPAIFAEWLAENNVQLVYKLATPQTIQLDPVTIQTLIGTNTIWTDVDDMEIAYSADTKKYVDAGSSNVKDIQLNETSIVNNGIANIPIAGGTSPGVVISDTIGTKGIYITSENKISVSPATESNCKTGNDTYRPITTFRQHNAVFYGLAKAAGDTTMASSSNAIGTYTTEAKSAIQTMLGIDLATIASQVDIPLTETVSGSTVSITGQPNVRYVCGEISTISITPPAAGSMEVIFESGTTATVLTVPSTVKWPVWFDPESLETETTYEILITDGVYGSVMTWET